MDAIVIGAGPNGLVAANLLADEGWSVLVLEEQPEPGGAVRTAELTLPGFHHDSFSAFYPLAAASPAFAGLRLEEWGLRWRNSPAALAHPCPGGAALLWPDIDRTAEGLDAVAPGDGEAWRTLFSVWDAIGEDIVGALLQPFPPLLPAGKLAVKLRRDLLRFARLAIVPVRRMAEERFHGPQAGLLLAGNAMHADLTPEMPLSGFFGFLLCGLGQSYGYPAPEGGSGELTRALVDRLRARGGEIACNQRVDRIEVRNGRAVGVLCSDGSSHPAARAVLADVSALALYRDLLDESEVPGSIRRDLDAFHLDNGTVKVDWALEGSCPWADDDLCRAGTVHLADDMDHLTMATTQLACSTIPARPPLVLGQMDVVDPTRSPEGTATMWAYAHVPQNVRADESGVLKGIWDEAETDAFADRMESEIERHAPGFRARIRARHVMGPVELERADRNLIGGAINGGTAQLHQQLVFRPTPGWPGPSTPIDALYLASASAHPGGGVHGACGANAAHAALGAGRGRWWLLGGLASAAAVAAIGRRRA